MTSSSRAEICEPVSSRSGIAVSTALLVAVEWHHRIAIDLHSQWSHWRCGGGTTRRAGPMYQQICRGMRGMILNGAFASGARLPATRALDDDLGVSRNVVLLRRHGAGGGLAADRETRPSGPPTRVELVR